MSSVALAALLAVLSLQEPPGAAADRPADRLVGRAVLPAATFAPGPTSGTRLWPGPINGHSVPFRNRLSEGRVLTGADFDIESMQRVADGTLWFGDEFGPFLLHTDARGRVLEPPVPLPDFDTPGGEIRSPQNPGNEDANAGTLCPAGRRRRPAGAWGRPRAMSSTWPRSSARATASSPGPSTTRRAWP